MGRSLLTQPLFHIFEHPFSGRDLILLFGGVFLLFKGTMELRERIEGQTSTKRRKPCARDFLDGDCADCGARCGVLTRQRDYRCGHGAAFIGHDDCGDYRHWHYVVGL